MSNTRIFQKFTTMRNPHTAQLVSFRPGQRLPSWADDPHLNPDLFGDPPRDPLLDYEDWTNEELADELRRRGLQGKGRKKDKIARLEEWDDEQKKRHGGDVTTRLSVAPIDPMKDEADRIAEGVQRSQEQLEEDEEDDVEVEVEDDD